MPDFMVKPLVNVLAPLSHKDEAEFWITPVTFVPMTAEMVVFPKPAPELVIVPMLLTATVVILIADQFVLIVRSPVPVIPPVTVSVLPSENGVDNVKLLLSATAPLKVAAALLIMVNVFPLLPEATLIGFVNVPAKPPFNVAFALPLVYPRVTVAAPKALALV